MADLQEMSWLFLRQLNAGGRYGGGSWNRDGKGLNSNESNVNRGVKEKWKLPSPGMIKLNVDGGLDQKNGLFGTRAVCRDDQETCIGILTTPGVGFPSPYICEMMALRNGLHFCVQAGFTHVQVECDCQVVVNAIHLAEKDLSSEGAIVDEIRTLLSYFQSVSLGFISRSSNNVAHYVAKYAISIRFHTYWWRMVPEWLSHVLVADLCN
ncbi:PREDICTED: uncharacterized protein LOC101299621 [Fragaria vesca subsp. vesca]